MHYGKYDHEIQGLLHCADNENVKEEVVDKSSLMGNVIWILYKIHHKKLNKTVHTLRVNIITFFEGRSSTKSMSVDMFPYRNKCPIRLVRKFEQTESFRELSGVSWENYNNWKEFNFTKTK